MINNKVLRLVSTVLLLIIALCSTISVSAANWYKGSLHQHTGFSAGLGYDERFDPLDPSTWSDGCGPILEGHPLEGKNVSSLTQSALNQDLSWLSFTDHSYCANESEFERVKNDLKN